MRDADHIIRHFNVGSFGGRSDGGIWFEDSELKLIENEPQETSGHNLSEAETTTIASADTDTDSGERTRKKL